MKSPAGRPRPAAKRQVRLDLRRAAPPPPPEDEMADRQTSNFWKWFAIVAIFHIALLVLVLIYYHPAETPPPPTPFFSLVPQGDTVKGTPGAQQAVKVGASTPAPMHHHHHLAPKPQPPVPVTPPPTPTAVRPSPVEKTTPEPVVQEENAPVLVTVKPKPKPTPPKPKIKVDLHLADGPAQDEPVPKPKHVKKLPPPVAEDRDDAPDSEASNQETDGLSKEQIAEKLGRKLDAEGVTRATKSGRSGAADGHDNPFGDFYNSIREQITNKWQEPNQNDPTATDPILQIHVDRDGRVPPESVTLLRSSGNQAIDDSALSAARSMGYTLQPLPEGCPPDISISLKITN